MISKNVNEYCKEDLSLIENYEKAANDKKQTWHCHHRLETDLGLTTDELIEQGKYFNVHASELIFLTPTEHARLHNKEKRQKQSRTMKKYWSNENNRNKQSDAMKGEKNPMYGKNPEDYMSEEAIKEKRKKLSIAAKGEKNPMYGKNPEDYMSEEAIKEKRQKQSSAITKRPWMNNGIVRVRPKTQEEIEQYLEQGYNFGMKLNNYITKNIT